MSKHTPIAPGPEDSAPRLPRKPSLVERAANVYDFGAALRAPKSLDPAEDRPAPRVEVAPSPPPSSPTRPRPARFGSVSREKLASGGFIVPGAAPTALAEEFRVVKRQLLAGMDAGDRGRTILVCSARPGEGKTFCATNLALSLAAEKDVEVVLIDADVAKPTIARTLGLEADGPGLLDALADPALDVEACLIHTDVERLAVLPAGTAAHDATERLASARTRALLDRLHGVAPNRIVIFDSPPALAASPAGVLAMHAGQAVVVVRAERTAEGDLRQALELISACPKPQLLLNGVELGSGAKGFGSYYGAEA